MASLDLRPLSLGELLDRTFTLYRTRFVLFLGISAIPNLFVLAIQLAQDTVILPSHIPGTTGVRTFPAHSSAFAAAPIALGLLLFIIRIFAGLFAQGATITAVSEIYLGRSISVRDSFRKVRGEVGTIFGVLFLNGAAIVVGFILLIFPGIYAACRLMVSVPAALVENIGPRDALERSWALTQDFAGRAFLISLLYIALLYAAIGLFQAPFLIGMAMYSKDPSMIRVFMVCSQIGGVITVIFIQPILNIAASVFYFDLRVRKEAFDLQVMMQPLGAGAPAIGGVRNILT